VEIRDDGLSSVGRFAGEGEGIRRVHREEDWRAGNMDRYRAEKRGYDSTITKMDEMRNQKHWASGNRA
jgi:hypothetical protein